MPEVIKINKKIINPKQATGWETSERIEGETSFEIRICNKNTTMPIILYKHYPFFIFCLERKNSNINIFPIIILCLKSRCQWQKENHENVGQNLISLPNPAEISQCWEKAQFHFPNSWSFCFLLYTMRKESCCMRALPSDRGRSEDIALSSCFHLYIRGLAR